jgi:hypothetical protein
MLDATSRNSVFPWMDDNLEYAYLSDLKELQGIFHPRYVQLRLKETLTGRPACWRAKTNGWKAAI